MQYFYLHGFASGPRSAKAKYFQARFRDRHLTLTVPDLNQPTFRTLTLSRQIHQVQSQFLPAPEPVTLIGSSFGGLTSAWIAQHNPQVERIILLAPAFNFLEYWLPTLGPEGLRQWQTRGSRSIFHYGDNAEAALDYGFVVDCQGYEQGELGRSVPTLIFHGTQDEVIPVEASQRFARERPWVQLRELESDHSLASVISTLWRGIQDFCSI